MKRTTSFHLEEDILDEIDEYRNKHKLSSRNSALERMLLERRNLLMVINRVESFKEVKEVAEVETRKPEIDIFDRNINKSITEMPD